MVRPAIAAVVVGLEARLAALDAKPNRTSANSSRPPSSDGPHVKPAPPRTPSGERRGGQPGHPGHERVILPPDQVVEYTSARCRRSRRLRPEPAHRPGCAKTAGVCREILAVGESLWTFAGRDGVEPTKNAVERAVRHAVCGWKTSSGTDREWGSRFVERMRTVVASCRQQGHGVLDLLVQAVTGAKPSLLPQGA